MAGFLGDVVVTVVCLSIDRVLLSLWACLVLSACNDFFLLWRSISWSCRCYYCCFVVLKLYYKNREKISNGKVSTTSTLFLFSFLSCCIIFCCRDNNYKFFFVFLLTSNTTTTTKLKGDLSYMCVCFNCFFFFGISIKYCCTKQ